MERAVKGIFIPIEIWETRELSWNEKILFLEIDSFTRKGKDCYFSDDYITELLDCSIATAKRVIASLIKKGYVRKTRFDGRRRFVETCWGFGPLSDERAEVSKMSEQESQFCDHTYRELPNTSQEKDKSSSCSVAREEDSSQQLGFFCNEPTPEFRAAPSRKDYGDSDFIADLVSAGIDEQLAKDWSVQRKEKKMARTQSIVKFTIREMDKIPDKTRNELMELAVMNGWGGFKASYYTNAIKKENDTGRNFKNSTEDALLLKDGRERHYTNYFPSTDELLGNESDPR